MIIVIAATLGGFVGTFAALMLFARLHSWRSHRGYRL